MGKYTNTKLDVIDETNVRFDNTQLLLAIANELAESNRLKRLEIQQSVVLQVNDFKLKGLTPEITGIAELSKALEDQA